MRFFLLLLLCFAMQSTLPVVAQLPRFKPTTIVYDTAYLNRSPSKWSIRLYTISKYQQFRLYSGSTGASLRYAPNKFLAIGGGASYNRLNLDLAFYSFSNNPQDDNTHESKTFDFIGSLYTGQHMFEIFLQQSTGMFGWLYENGGILPSAADTLIPFRPDINAFNVGADYHFLFNSERMTFASLIGTEVQKRSAGGALLGVNFNSFNLHADSSIVPVGWSAFFEDHGELNQLNIFNLGLSAGYGYTFVFPLHLFLTLSIAPGISFTRSEVYADNAWYVAGDPVKVSFKVISRGGFGYSGNKIYSILSLVNDQSLINLNHKNHFQEDLGKVKLVFGYRLH
ncbi:MAG: DUF4421 domain-containing protein [Chitinophagales bacterium]|nr:DUF4421 domain-containing protein [Chitinophagales bacterium]